jgi:predicted nuclease of restriction endonuclease-like (RecB) superfamily
MGKELDGGRMIKQTKQITEATKLLFQELSLLIDQGKQQVISAVNNTLTVLFWHIGEKINTHILRHKRAEYGEQIVVTLSRQLVAEYGNSFEEKNLRRMMQFAEQFTDIEIVVTLSRQLSWSHFLVLIPIKKREAKIFYAEISAKERWGVRELREQIKNKIFERKSMANIQLHQDNKPTDAVFKDPYFLDFLNLKEGFLESDLESAILRELESFILELGNGFTFVARQKRMIIDNEDFYLDLLFYHRKLKRLVAIELKLGKFHAKYKGQMELYLKWLDRYEKQEGENPPIGLLLCAETSREQIDLLEMYKDGIMVAEYWTELPPKKELGKRLHAALIQEKERLARRKLLT